MVPASLHIDGKQVKALTSGWFISEHRYSELTGHEPITSLYTLIHYATQEGIKPSVLSVIQL